MVVFAIGMVCWGSFFIQAKGMYVWSEAPLKEIVTSAPTA